MSNSTVESLICDLLEWVAERERTYEEVMEAWRTSCPRLPVWEEANDLGLVKSNAQDGRNMISVTCAGHEFLARNRARGAGSR